MGIPSFRGGPTTVWIGLLLQWGTALLIATIFATAAPRVRWLPEHTVAAGLAYGAIIFVVMNNRRDHPGGHVVWLRKRCAGGGASKIVRSRDHAYPGTA